MLRNSLVACQKLCNRGLMHSAFEGGPGELTATQANSEDQASKPYSHLNQHIRKPNKL